MKATDVETCRELLESLNDQIVALRAGAKRAFRHNQGEAASRQTLTASAFSRQANALAALISHAEATRNPVAEAFTAEQEERRCPAR